MKKNLYVFLFLSIISACISEKEEPYITITENEIVASSSGSTEVVRLISNNSWSVSAPEWCIVNPSYGGRGEFDVVIAVKENSSYDSRKGDIVFSSEDITSNLLVSQAAAATLIVPEVEFELSSDAQNIKVVVNANVNYNVSLEADWIHSVGTKALSSDRYEFSIDRNDDYKERVGYINITSSEKSIKVKVHQAQKDAIILSDKDFLLSSDEQTVKVKLAANVDYHVDIPEEVHDWITMLDTKGLQDYYITLNIKANVTYEKRQGDIVVTNTNKGITEVIHIEQSPKDAIILLQKEYVVSSDAQCLEIDIQSNVELDVVVSSETCDWISSVNTRTLQDHKITLSIQANETYDSRIGEVKVFKRDTDYYETIVIKQSQNDIMQLSKKEFFVTGQSQTLNVEVLSNIDVSVMLPDEFSNWLSVVETKGLEVNKITFSLSRNVTNEIRTANVLLVGVVNGVEVYETIYINQEYIVTTLNVVKTDDSILMIDLDANSKVVFSSDALCIIASDERYDILMRDIKRISYKTIE